MDYNEIAQRYSIPVEEVLECVERARRSMVPKTKNLDVVEGGKVWKLRVTREGLGPLKTVQGNFYQFSFKVDDKWGKYSVLIMSDLSQDFYPIFRDTQNLVLRTDSGCETGQLFGDLTCECREQLHQSMAKIAENGEGMVINIPRQDGRGMGLPFKLGTLRLQTELGVDTVESASMLEPDGSRDVRTYAGVVAILKFLQIPGQTLIHLKTNNPKKVEVFKENGYQVAPEPNVISPTPDTIRHLRAKQKELGHIDLVIEKEEGDS